VSVREALEGMDKQYKDDVEVISLHSCSKGLLGECGLRGGYMETHNLSERG
jgi:aspartate/methionine/tyrosine aminotransferase